jgi:GT2 family glycosyltransferase
MAHVISTAVIVHWGDSRPTIEAAIRYYRQGLFSNVVIVANDLQDRPRELFNSNIAWVVPPRNLGFGGGCNFGAWRYPAAKYAFFNSDVTLDSEAISMCLDVLDLPYVGISAPTLLFPDGTLQSGCGFLSKNIKAPICNVRPRESISECEWVTGAALFCRGELFNSMTFDGSYFLGCEDVDFCLRANRNGWKVVVISAAIGTHPARTTLKGARPVYYEMRNEIWLSRKYQSLLCNVAITLYMLRVTPRVGVADVIKKRRLSHSRLIVHGLIDGWRALPKSSEPLLDEPIPTRWIDWGQN